MGMILFILAGLMELGICIVAIKSGQRQDKRKVVVRLIAGLLLALFVVVGLLDGFVRYGFLMLEYNYYWQD